jgi:hypothetical protein
MMGRTRNRDSPIGLRGINRIRARASIARPAGTVAADGRNAWKRGDCLAIRTVRICVIPA